jgi:hypothetical protein
MSGNSSTSSPRTERLLLRLSLPGREPIEAYVARRLSVGRSPDNVFVIDDPAVDRHHAEVQAEEKDGVSQFVLRCVSSDAFIEVGGAEMHAGGAARRRALPHRPGGVRVPNRRG